MRISAAVEHHPSRAELVEPLLPALAPLDAALVPDPEPDHPTPATWRTYRAALEARPADATHHLVIQDDAWPCASFAATVERAVSARPDDLLVLCVCGNAVIAKHDLCAALARGESFLPLHRITFVPAVAVVWPAELADRLLAYVDAQRWPTDRLADDEVIYRACGGLGIVPVATVPSIVEHPDIVASVIDRWKPQGGRNLARVAVCFAEDGATLSFT